MMFSSILVLLILLIHQASSSSDTTLIDNTVQYCQNKLKRFAATEHKYVKKAERKPGEPVLYAYPVDEFRRTVHEIRQNQRIFECIRDMLNKNCYENLVASHEYRSLVQKCKSEKPTTPQCDPSYKYKTINGTCNNLCNPRWGSALSCTRRLFPANYEGASGMRKSFRGGKKLPEPRFISLNILKPLSRPTKDYNSLFAFFGQVVAHDLADFVFGTVDGEKNLDCCAQVRERDKHPECIPILHQPDDPFYSMINISCISVVRVVPCDSCSVDQRFPLTQVSSYIDCSLMYGPSDVKAKFLRRNDGSGKLRSQNTESGELLPDDGKKGSRCGDAKQQQYCFKTGDVRTNQLTPLMIFQTLLLREHNRIAGKLKVLNPHWDEEKLFQEARKIVIAEFQVIIYKDYLPVLIGPNLMSKYGLNMYSGSSYDSTVDPSILVEFNAAAFRVHSLLPGKVLDDEDYEYLQTMYINAEPLYRNRTPSFLTKMANFPAEKYDRFMATDVTQWLFRERIGTYGFDLASVDVQRGRDVGLPTYPQVIEYMENRPETITEFTDLKKYLVPECRSLLRKIYHDVRDIDLWVGLNCERIPNDMIISPTAAEMIAEQFRRLKYGDRFYVEHDITLTEEQRQTLLNASLAKLICDNAKVESFQPLAMLFPSIENIPQSCSVIPGVNLEKWKEVDENFNMI